MLRSRSCRLATVAAALVLPLVALPAQRGHAPFRSTYTVSVPDPAASRFHVTAEFTNIAQPTLDLALPTWTPGWYTVENYAKNILRLRIVGPDGATLGHTMPRKATWRVRTAGLSRITVEFEYLATVLSLNTAKLTRDMGFFTGTELFLEPVGHRAGPITVHFQLPADWKIAAALRETSDPMTYTAADYDELVDAPVQLGHFDVTRFEAGGKPHYFVAQPAGSWDATKTARFTDLIAKIVRTDSAIFGSLPYDKYLYFYHFARPESNAGGALEHLNSHVTMAASPATTPEQLIGTVAHEYFHLWNVKRIRPVEMWPYDYSREQETPQLWVSEGFTNYYGSLSELRAGINPRATFLTDYAGAIRAIEENEARKYISPAEASSSTWLGYDTPVAFGISYYPWGQVLGGLLDLSVRHDSRGKSGLDDVMRALWREHYLKGRGFAAPEFEAIVSRLAGRSYADFFQRYVWGTQIAPYDTILGYAGYRLERASQAVGLIGVQTDFLADGVKVTAVTPDGAAAAAGVQVGDILVSVDGRPWAQGGVRDKPGAAVTLVVQRAGAPMSLKLTVGSRSDVQYRIVDVASPTPAQLAARDAWLGK